MLTASCRPRVYQSDMTISRTRTGGWEVNAYPHDSDHPLGSMTYYGYTKRESLRLMAERFNGANTHRGMKNRGYCIDCGQSA